MNHAARFDVAIKLVVVESETTCHPCQETLKEYEKITNKNKLAEAVGSPVPVSYTCGFRPAKDNAIIKELSFAHMTGVRLGTMDSFNEEEVLSVFQRLGRFEAAVSGRATWGPNTVVLLQLSDQILNVLSALDRYSKPERDGNIYTYKPKENCQLKEPHISLGRRQDLIGMVPVGTTIAFEEAFIKREGPHDPEPKHIVTLQ